FALLCQTETDATLHLCIDNPQVKNFDPWEWLWQQNLVELNCYDSIVFEPFYGNITDFYSQFHCAVFPTRAEGIGLSSVESMAHGIPTIVSYNSGVTSYAHEDTCCLLTDLK